MFITTKAEFIWDGEKYVETYTEGYEYEGEIALLDLEDDLSSSSGGTGGTGGNIGLSGADGGAGNAGASGSGGSHVGATNCCAYSRPCSTSALAKNRHNWSVLYPSSGGGGGSAPTDHGAGGLAGYYLLDPGTAVTMNNSGTLTGRS